MGKKAGKLTIFAVILLLFLPAVAVMNRIKDQNRDVLCRSVSEELLMQGQDEPGKLRIYLIPGDMLDINSATARELELLPKVGEVLAERIVEYRNAHGGFADTRQLLEIEGIGEASFQAIAPFIYAGDTT